MEALKPTEAKLIQRVSVFQTLKAIPLGETRLIKNRVIKASVIRSAISKLKAEGYLFNATERGLVDSVLITRIK